MDLLHEPLTEVQARILGVLVEKQLATPSSYPLTEKALLAGCNQTTNREPVVTFDTTLLRPALIRLRERGLTRRILRAGERAEKHAHRLEEQLQLSSDAPLAVLAVLLLRGAQTPGELRARTQRLLPAADATVVEAALAELRDRGLAANLARRPGEKQARWRHRLCGTAAPTGITPGTATPVEPPTYAADTARLSATAAEVVSPPADTSGDDAPTLSGLADTIRKLAARVAVLEEHLRIDHDTARAEGYLDRPD
jgi:uncharacterized protein YceH (UPF0502 family)